MSIIRDFFVKEKPVFTGISRGLGGFGFGSAGVVAPEGTVVNNIWCSRWGLVELFRLFLQDGNLFGTSLFLQHNW